MSDPSSLTQILWSDDPATRRALWTILGLVVPIALVVFLPPIVRVLRLFFLERRLRDTLDEYESKGKAAQRGALREWLRDSALTRQFAEFERRWTIAQLSEGTGRAPIRLLDVLEDQPLLPIGPRRSLLPVLPGLFLGIGVFGALFGLIPGVTHLGDAASAAAAEAGAIAAAAVDPLAQQLGLALRATAWGFASAIAASVVGRLVEGSFDARGRGLDEILAHAYEAVSPGELAEITRQTQQKTLDTLGRELTQFAHELNERLERGLQRIEQSSSRAASLVSQEQRGALHTVVQELSLSVRQGVDHHLAELRSALQRAVDYQSSVTNGLSETYERMVENAQMQDRVARTLGESANALDAAARSLRSEVRPGDPASARTGSDELELERLRESEAIAAQIAEDLGQALRGFTEQVRRIDETMEALRREIHEDSRVRKETPADPPRSAPRPTAAAPSMAPAQATPGRPSLPSSAAPAPSVYGPTTPASPAAAAPASPPLPARPAASAASTNAPTPPAHAPAPVQPLPRVEAPVPAPPRRDATSGPPAPRLETDTADLASTEGPIGRELSLSGFRVGAPRAQGPDPYERLAAGNEPPSNVRHFPTRERELGDELKLSGLLGPGVPRSGPPPTIPAGRPAGSSPRPAPAPERRPEPARPDDADEQG
ncbi:MAG: hypothetical protein U0900_07440 [Myxococcota bacterium]